MILDLERVVGKRQHLGIGETIALALLLRGRLVEGRLAGAALGIDHLDLLGAERAPEHGPVALLEGGLVDVELVDVDRPLDHVLAQAPGAGDEDRILEPGLGVDREDHPGGRQIGAHHLLDAGRERHLEVIETLVDPIGDRPVGEQRRVAAPDRIQHHLLATDVQIGIVLAGKARGRQILGRGRRAHRDRQILAIGLHELAPGGQDLLARPLGQARRIDDLAAAGAGAGQRLDIGLVEPIQLRMQFSPRIRLGERVAKRLRRDRKAVRLAHAERHELPVHLAERGILAADQRHVGIGDVGKPTDIGGLGHDAPHFFALRIAAATSAPARPSVIDLGQATAFARRPPDRAPLSSAGSRMEAGSEPANAQHKAVIAASVPDERASPSRIAPHQANNMGPSRQSLTDDSGFARLN